VIPSGFETEQQKPKLVPLTRYEIPNCLPNHTEPDAMVGLPTETVEASHLVGGYDPYTSQLLS
jgi:hypothetical protein